MPVPDTYIRALVSLFGFKFERRAISDFVIFVFLGALFRSRIIGAGSMTADTILAIDHQQQRLN